MKHTPASFNRAARCGLLALLGLALLAAAPPATAQTLINVNFGAGSASHKTGFAATGQATNDFWNLYRHYDPKYVPGMPLVSTGLLAGLKYADAADSRVSLAVSNAPGVWGNSTGDNMFDAYIFPQDGGSMLVTVSNLDAGRYHFYLYGHADADVTGEQNSVFSLRTGTNTLGPLAAQGAPGWKAGQPWQERQQYVVFRDVTVAAGEPVVIEVAPGPNGVAVLNGLQIISRGTSPPRLTTAATPPGPLNNTNLLFREVRYDGRIADTEARFSVVAELDSQATNEISALLFEGDVALLPAELPAGLRIVGVGNQFLVLASKSGHYRLQLELVAKINRQEPWNQIAFHGPAAAIASLAAQAGGAEMELQLLSGTPAENANPAGSAPSSVRGVLGADRLVSLRWKSRTAEVARKSFVTVDTTATAQVTPTVIKFSTEMRYEILQAGIAKLTIAIPASHALTKIQGAQIRDWRVKPGDGGGDQILSVEFLKPVEKSYTLTLLSEQPVDFTHPAAQLLPPQPLEVERESGSFAVSADEMAVELSATDGLRQVNAAAGELAAYRFYARPFALTAGLKRIEPVVNVADRVTARLEETRLILAHALTVNVEKAGIYALELTPDLPVADVRGEGIEDWKVTGGKLRVNFGSRLLGTRQLQVQLEQSYRQFPTQIVVNLLRVKGAARETAQVGAAAAPGIRLKTGSLSGLREIPVNTLETHAEESLAYRADQPDWQLSLTAERLAARVVAEVFNLLTVGDGLVGGSATIRYGIINQGVREFRVKLPAHWKNVEFTGPNIRRKDQQGDVWTIALQDKAWGGYTLVVTYDYQFDARKATLDAAGAHTLEVERETGSVAITSAGGLKLDARPAIEPLRVIDQSELSETDRALVARPVLLAYRYTGGDYQLQVDVTRHEQTTVLDAVADRTQLTTVLTDAGEMLTEASFMVKNNEKQFQKFRLPADARLWGCYVNGEPVKGELDGEWLLVSLPREANRDQAFAVEIKYAQQVGSLQNWLPKTLRMEAPMTDVPNTYAEWEFFVPPGQRLSGFGGNMAVARGTLYGLREAWEEFGSFYTQLWHEVGVAAVLTVGLALLVAGLIWSARRRGGHGVIEVLVVFAVLLILAGMMLPALSKAKQKAVRIQSVNNLKQIALAASIYAGDNQNRLPASFDQMKNELGTEKVIIDPETGEHYMYVGGGKDVSNPNGILAYSPADNNGRAVAFLDGSVAQLTTRQFEEALQKEASAYRGGLETGGKTVALGDITETIAPVAKPASPAEAKPFGGAGAYYRMGPGVVARNMQALPQADAANPSPVDSSPLMSRSTALLPQATVPAAPAIPAPSPAPAARAAGLRSIRIDIPRIGHAFNFTKVLNIGREPLSVRVSVIPSKVFDRARMLLQLAGFLGGLLVLGRQWISGRPRGFWLAVGAALAIGSACDMLIGLRLLHFMLIVIPPAGILLVVIWLARKFFRRHAGATDDTPPPMAATLALILIAAFTALPAASSRAEDSSKAVPATNLVSITAAAYSGKVGERVAEFDATLTLSAFGTNQAVRLFGDDVAVEAFSVKSGAARLERQGNSLGLVIDRPGEVILEIKLLAKLGGDVTRRQLAFGIPPALASRLSVAIAEPDADVDLPTAVSWQRNTAEQETRVEAIIGSAGRVEMQWTPRVKRAAETAATVFCQNTTLVAFSGGVDNTRSILDYQVTQGELRQARVRLPAGQRLLRVEGEAIRTWELKQEDGEVLVVDLIKGVSPAYRLTVETGKILDKLPARLAVATAHPLGVQRETGLIAVRGSEELSLALEGAQDLQRVDNAEFARASGQSGDGLIAAFRFLKPDFQLAANLEAVRPQVEAVVRNLVRIGQEQIQITADVDYTIKRAGIFALKLSLPADYAVRAVNGGNNPQWTEREENGARVLDVTLKERTIGADALHVELLRLLKELPGTVPVAGVRPLGVQKVSGFVSVSPEPGVGVKAGAFDGLTEIPAASLPGAPGGAMAGVLAYKLVAGESGAADWKLGVSTEIIESWVRAEVATFITITDTLASGRALVRYDIQNAPVKEFRLKIPTAWKNIEITGANIRRRDQTGGEWRVELQNKVKGIFLLNVTWEQPGNLQTNQLAVTGVEALGVERETGTLAILAKPPLQVSAGSASGELVRIDEREIPEWAGAAAATRAGHESVALAYRYTRPGYQLAVQVKRFEDAAVLQALVDNLHLTTVVADDGQMMTEMSLGIHNNGRQDLEVELPAGAQVWSAFVAGQPVRPTERDGRLLLPLERSGPDGAPVLVELTYVGADKFPKGKGRLEFVSPKVDMPLKNARWEFYLPPDYDYRDFAGSMTREIEAAPVYQSYSLFEYSRQESSKQAALKAEMKSVVSNAQHQSDANNVQELNRAYNRARRGGGWRDDEVDREVRKIEGDLRKAQGSNLINAQKAYTVENLDKLGLPSDAPSAQAADGMFNYDADAAEQQWAKLQQAQELGVTRLQPLRVNLPTRGLRHSFAQVLQTEIRKPMTVQLTAQSNKGASWTERTALAGAGFLVLWALSAWLARRRSETAVKPAA